MKAAPFDYVAPKTIDEACTILAEAGGGATVIAGGQTLMPLLALRMSQPFILIDINDIDELKGVRAIDDGTWIGPATKQADGLTDADLQRRLPLLVTALREVGHHQTRNRGTIGGSIVFGEPAAEMPATAVALGATIVVRSVRGERRVPADEFYVGPYMTVLEPDELVTGIIYPNRPAGSIDLFREVCQRPGDFALVGVLGTLAFSGGRIERASLAWFGMGPTPIKARQAEAALIGSALEAIDHDAIAKLAIADTAPFDDHHATAEYRRTVGRRILARLLRETLPTRIAA
jgi:carbon-monoxide dehydrogenase medium subunit